MLQVVPRLQYFSSQADGEWRDDAHVKETLGWFAEQGSEVQAKRGGGDESQEKSGLGSADDKALCDMLYHVENLRKRPGAED
jgi:tRNA (guanine-N(7)-)-methyltransferase subunit TRM82